MRGRLHRPLSRGPLHPRRSSNRVFSSRSIAACFRAIVLRSAMSAVARKSVILDGTSTTTCRGCMSEHRRQEPVWTSVRGAGVKAVRPAERGRSEATRLDVGEHTRTLLA